MRIKRSDVWRQHRDDEDQDVNDDASQCEPVSLENIDRRVKQPGNPRFTLRFERCGREFTTVRDISHQPASFPLLETRGSSIEYSTSARKFITTMTIAMRKKAPCASG